MDEYSQSGMEEDIIAISMHGGLEVLTWVMKERGLDVHVTQSPAPNVTRVRIGPKDEVHYRHLVCFFDDGRFDVHRLSTTSKARVWDLIGQYAFASDQMRASP